MTHGHFLTSASKFNIEPNGGIFDVSVKKRPRVTDVKTPYVFLPSLDRRRASTAGHHRRLYHRPDRGTGHDAPGA